MELWVEIRQNLEKLVGKPSAIFYIRKQIRLVFVRYTISFRHTFIIQKILIIATITCVVHPGFHLFTEPCETPTEKKKHDDARCEKSCTTPLPVTSLIVHH